eukprot:2205852-Rhodomonas_salina.2
MSATRAWPVEVQSRQHANPPGAVGVPQPFALERELGERERDEGDSAGERNPLGQYRVSHSKVVDRERSTP